MTHPVGSPVQVPSRNAECCKCNETHTQNIADLPLAESFWWFGEQLIQLSYSQFATSTELPPCRISSFIYR